MTEADFLRFSFLFNESKKYKKPTGELQNITWTFVPFQEVLYWPAKVENNTIRYEREEEGKVFNCVHAVGVYTCVHYERVREGGKKTQRAKDTYAQ